MGHADHECPCRKSRVWPHDGGRVRRDSRLSCAVGLGPDRQQALRRGEFTYKVHAGAALELSQQRHRVRKAQTMGCVRDADEAEFRNGTDRVPRVRRQRRRPSMESNVVHMRLQQRRAQRINVEEKLHGKSANASRTSAAVIARTRFPATAYGRPVSGCRAIFNRPGRRRGRDSFTVAPSTSTRSLSPGRAPRARRAEAGSWSFPVLVSVAFTSGCCQERVARQDGPCYSCFACAVQFPCVAAPRRLISAVHAGAHCSSIATVCRRRTRS